MRLRLHCSMEAHKRRLFLKERSTVSSQTTHFLGPIFVLIPTSVFSEMLQSLHLRKLNQIFKVQLTSMPLASASTSPVNQNELGIRRYQNATFTPLQVSCDFYSNSESVVKKW